MIGNLPDTEYYVSAKTYGRLSNVPISMCKKICKSDNGKQIYSNYMTNKENHNRSINFIRMSHTKLIIIDK